jgi:aspartyl-tRNA(Asn)/glutamyl-tRNA(Gln) amidotransferase subunit B
MSSYRATIGLEIHAELKTATKMFCSCKNDPDEKSPNKNICPVCMAHPGTLPVINKEAVRKVLTVGAALGAQLADYTEFDRKNYFYPDIPKGYQLSQYAHPLVQGGELAGVAITRVHLEEDTARSQHQGDKSLVDYNRAGVPLMELVTEPVIHDAETAGNFARELQLLLRYVDAGEANMEKGEMRVEANISISKDDTLGTKVEVKNLNSFRSAERAIAYEIQRQTEVLEKGEKVIQETRGWDEVAQSTFPQRKKESSHDYRYFPDPDLPKLMLSEIPEFTLAAIASTLPELPGARRARYTARGIKTEAANVLTEDTLLGAFFDAAVQGLAPENANLLSNYIVGDIAGKRAAGDVTATWLQDTKNATRLAQLISLIEKGLLSSRGAKDTLDFMFSTLGEPEAIAREHGLIQQSDTTLLTVVAQKIIEANPTVAADYRAGKAAALQFLIGQGMKETKGSANPESLRQALITLLG